MCYRTHLLPMASNKLLTLSHELGSLPVFDQLMLPVKAPLRQQRIGVINTPAGISNVAMLLTTSRIIPHSTKVLEGN